MLLTLTGNQVQPSGVTTDTVTSFRSFSVTDSNYNGVAGFSISGYPSTVTLTANGGTTPSTIDVTVVLPTPPPPNGIYYIRLDYYKDSGMLPVWEGQYTGTFTVTASCNLTANVAAPIGRGAAGGTWNGSAQVFTSGGTAPLTYVWTISSQRTARDIL